MNPFQFVSDWRSKLLGPLDARMNQTLDKGLEVARSRAHVRSGANKASIGGGYNQNTRTILLWADKEYSLIEERRGGDHAYLAPAAQAMAGVWQGNWNIELHFPNAAPMGRNTSAAEMTDRESRWRKKNLGFMARRKTKLVVRRWHRRYDAPWTADEVTLIR